MLQNKKLLSGPGGSIRPEALVGGQAVARHVQEQRRRVLALAGRGGPTPSSGDDPLKNLDLKNLNDLPLAKLSETANAVWERIRSTGLNVKVNPPPDSQLLSPNLAPGPRPGAPSSNSTTRTVDDPADLAVGGGGGAGKEQRLMAALAQAQEEKRELADRSELLRANLSMLESKNARMVREVESAEAGRSNALRLRDVLLEERDALVAQLREAQEEIKRASEGMEVREGALAALRQSQRRLQEELRDAVARLQAVDRSTESLRSQITSLESSRAAAATERDDVAAHLRELVGLVDQLSGLFEGEEAAAAAASAAPTSSDPSAAADADSATPSPVAAAAATLQQLRSTTEGAFAALRAARSELGTLRVENQQLAERAEALTHSNKELTATAEALQQQVAAARTELDEQRAAVAGLRSREEELQAALAASAAERDALAAAVTQLSAVKEEAAAAGVGLVELAKMSTQLGSLKEQLAASRASETDLQRRFAVAEVALLDARREAATTETRLRTQLEAAERDAAELRSALRSRTLATQAAKRSGVPHVVAAGQFVNTNRFWVPAELMFDFVKAVAGRETVLVAARGFLGIAVRSEDLNVMSVSTHWESIPHFEAWAQSGEARRHHYPSGVYQYVPRRGEGFPEDYIPFKDLNEPVNAKY